MRRLQAKTNRPGKAGAGKFDTMTLLLSLLWPVSET
jgi:hypothetical protein